MAKTFEPSIEQKNILELDKGKHLVLAPPGTGKTELLAQRVGNALLNGVDSSKMICLTFTNRAAKGMKSRIDERFPKNNLFIGNVHHFCSSFLFSNKLLPQSTCLMDEEDTEQLLLEAKDSLKIYTKRRVKEILVLNNYLKQTKLNFPKEVKIAPPNYIFAERQLLQICELYENLKDESNLLDFDDLLTFAYSFLNEQSISNNFSKFEWVQVDEVQDLNPIQWSIIELLSDANSHKVFFGDYEQAIFSFMGSKLESLHKIGRTCKVHNLQKNFRSPSYLLNLYIEYAKSNLKPTWKKEPIPDKVLAQNDDDLQLITINSKNNHEAHFIVNNIIPGLNFKTGNTAILVRWNKSADYISSFLSRKDINHFRISGFDLFRRKIVKDIMAFMSCLYDPSDRISWSRFFTIFAGITTLKDARSIVNKMFSIGVIPSDFLLFDNPLGLIENFTNDFKNKRIVVFDTETTGLNTETDDIIQIAAIEILNGTIGNSFEVYIDTDKSLIESEKIHNISKEYLINNSVERKKALSNFVEFINDDILLAHNLNYDVKILKSNLQRVGITTDILTYEKYYDSIEITKRLNPNLKSYKLKDLIQVFDLDAVNSHNAMDDVIATAKLTQKLYFIASTRVTLLQEFYAENKNKIASLKRNLAEHWKKLHLSFESPTTMRSIVDEFLEFTVNSVNYNISNEDYEHLQKLFRHFDATCQRKKLSILLEEYLPIYRIFKESDLLLGDEKIVISTIHKAKGLEFDNVIIPEATNLVYPSRYAKTPEEIEEDARLLYVALTRAKQKIIITYSDNQYLSRFLKPVSHFFYTNGRAIKNTIAQPIPATPTKSFDENKTEKAYSLEDVRQDYPNAYRKWNREEEEELKEFFIGGESYEEMAAYFGRKVGAIESRLAKLGLIEDPYANK
ncbi:MAG: UvrD-helicase domain-containing protein [Labilibaculum sp.]|nr:3'-5' exonuclease [Labilibaculum sp.]MBI9060264.1 UvrD-helicase domain-containing protein [Labilibaculum sp.]